MPFLLHVKFKVIAFCFQQILLCPQFRYCRGHHNTLKALCAKDMLFILRILPHQISFVISPEVSSGRAQFRLILQILIHSLQTAHNQHTEDLTQNEPQNELA